MKISVTAVLLLAVLAVMSQAQMPDTGVRLVTDTAGSIRAEYIIFT